MKCDPLDKSASSSIEEVRKAMEEYWTETSTVAQRIADTISFQRQSVSPRDIEALVDFNAGLRAANNVLVEIRRESETPLVKRIMDILDTALCSGNAHVETIRIYHNVIKVLNSPN